MRKREIHSVAHWAMMFLLLMFPLLMVGISAFGHTYRNEYVETSTLVQNQDQLIVDMNYVATYDDKENESTTYGMWITYKSISIDWTDYGFQDYNYNMFRLFNTGLIQLKDVNNNQYSQNNVWGNTLNQFSFVFATFTDGFNLNGDVNYTLLTYTYNEVDYRTDVNSWTQSFLDLPINAWYKSLMNVVGIGFTNSTVMNVIYVMPVYILWVFIFDVIVDCFLVIIKLPHKLLNRLSGGENE